MYEQNKQIKSKKRIIEHGEVFTSDREVNAMLDLVKEETERIDSRFLEPACGTGNFLTEILSRKLDVVKRKYKKSKLDFEKIAFIAASSIYGVDILEDNIFECRERLFNVFEKYYINIFKEPMENDYKKSIKFVFKKNILWGNALNMKMINGEPIIFSEWSLVMDSMVKRRDFRFDELLEGGQQNAQISMLGNMDWEYDDETNTYIPSPIKEYNVIDYRRVYIGK